MWLIVSSLSPHNLNSLFYCVLSIFVLTCGPMLVTEPIVVWLLFTVLVAFVFVTTTLASDCLLCQVLPCLRCVWKIHEGVGWHYSARSSSDGQVIWVARLSSNSKNRENLLLINNKKSFLLKHVCETINNKQTMFAFLAKKEERKSREEEWWWCMVRMTLMSLKSGTLNFCKVWRLFGMPQV